MRGGSIGAASLGRRSEVPCRAVVTISAGMHLFCEGTKRYRNQTERSGAGGWGRAWPGLARGSVAVPILNQSSYSHIMRVFVLLLFFSVDPVMLEALIPCVDGFLRFVTLGSG